MDNLSNGTAYRHLKHTQQRQMIPKFYIINASVAWNLSMMAVILVRLLLAMNSNLLHCPAFYILCCLSALTFSERNFIINLNTTWELKLL